MVRGYIHGAKKEDSLIGAKNAPIGRYFISRALRTESRGHYAFRRFLSPPHSSFGFQDETSFTLRSVVISHVVAVNSFDH